MRGGFGNAPEGYGVVVGGIDDGDAAGGVVELVVEDSAEVADLAIVIEEVEVAGAIGVEQVLEVDDRGAKALKPCVVDGFAHGCGDAVPDEGREGNVELGHIWEGFLEWRDV